MEKLKQALSFLNVLDSEGKLSITNIAVIIVLVKLAIAPTVSITEAGTLLVALSNYAYKRFTNQKTDIPEADPLRPEVDAISAKIEEMAGQVSSLALQNGMKRGI